MSFTFYHDRLHDDQVGLEIKRNHVQSQIQGCYCKRCIDLDTSIRFHLHASCWEARSSETTGSDFTVRTSYTYIYSLCLTYVTSRILEERSSRPSKLKAPSNFNKDPTQDNSKLLHNPKHTAQALNSSARRTLEAVQRQWDVNQEHMQNLGTSSLFPEYQVA